MKTSQIIDNFFKIINDIPQYHKPKTHFHNFFDLVLKEEIRSLFSEEEPVDFGPFGKLIIPFVKFGNDITTLNLFEIDELILFAYYWKHRSSYKKAFDLGANIGVHSILMAKCGYSVTSFEPDPWHFQLLNDNIKANLLDGDVLTVKKAIASSTGKKDFIVVKGNTTGSHIVGAKPNPYGDLEKIGILTINFLDILQGGVDLIKMDIEGAEKDVILLTKRENWKETDAFISIHDEANARGIFNYLNKLGVNIFSQKTGWGKIYSPDDMPFSHYEGSVFISCKEYMEW